MDAANRLSPRLSIEIRASARRDLHDQVGVLCDELVDAGEDVGIQRGTTSGGAGVYVGDGGTGVSAFHRRFDDLLRRQRNVRGPLPRRYAAGEGGGEDDGCHESTPVACASRTTRRMSSPNFSTLAGPMPWACCSASMSAGRRVAMSRSVRALATT